MALPTTYNTGTATVNNGSTAITGQGTTWLTSGIQAGDFFWAAGQSVRILSVNSNTSLTLAYNWPGSSRSADIYEIVFTPEAGRVLASTRAVLDALSNGNVAALAALVSAANKLPYFTGDGVADVTDLSAHGRAILALSGGAGKFIRSIGANAAVMQDLLGTVAQSGGVPTGAIVERGSNANGEFVRLLDGTQVCTSGALTHDINVVDGSLYRGADATWTYPATFVFVGGSGGSCVGSTAVWVNARGGTGSTIYNGRATASRTGDIFRLFAIGRWF